MILTISAICEHVGPFSALGSFAANLGIPAVELACHAFLAAYVDPVERRGGIVYVALHKISSHQDSSSLSANVLIKLSRPSRV